MSQSQHLGPIIVENEAIIGLEREPLDATGRHTEASIQTLVHEYPKVLPMDEVEPAYRDMMSLCTELPLRSGFLDNLWMTPRGGIVIGECKLFRNPQARREVIAQALDYARALQRMNYVAFEAAIGKARGVPAFRLWQFVSESLPESDVMPEAAFIDGVSRRLRDAQLMILIIGDGIREELEDLAGFLQLHAGLHANLALIDLSLWRLPDGRRLIIPRLPMKTATIVRGIVGIDTAVTGIQVMPDETATQTMGRTRGSTANASAKSASAEEFLALMRESEALSASVLETLFGLVSDIGVEVRFTPQYAIFEIQIAGTNRAIFDVKYTGEIWGGALVSTGSDPDMITALEPLLTALANSMNAHLSFTPQKYHRLKAKDGRRLKPSDFSGQEQQVVDVMRQIVSVVSQHLSAD